MTNEQIDKLSDLFMDTGKALLIAALAIPTFFKIEDIMAFTKSFAIGVTCVYFSLKILESKK